MKKIFIRFVGATFGAFLLFGLSANVSAAVGDVIGHVYSSDIRTCIDGIWVNSYNIGGKTAIIVEDLAHVNYYDDIRTLIIDSEFRGFESPEGTSDFPKKIGHVLGDIYETDIRTYYKAAELPCFSLGGKMAVCVEDFAANLYYSPNTHYQYTWNPEERTVIVETMDFRYGTFRDILDEKRLNAYFDVDSSTVEFESDPISYGQIRYNGTAEAGQTFTYNGTPICRVIEHDDYRVITREDGSHFVDKSYTHRHFYYDETGLADRALRDFEAVYPTYEENLAYYDYNDPSWMMSLEDSFKTDEYGLFYFYQANAHGGREILMKFPKPYGDAIDYSAQFEYRPPYYTMRLEQIRIDRENETVTLKYAGNYYRIDLKTDEITQIEQPNSEDI